MNPAAPSRWRWGHRRRVRRALAPQPAQAHPRLQPPRGSSPDFPSSTLFSLQLRYFLCLDTGVWDDGVGGYQGYWAVSKSNRTPHWHSFPCSSDWACNPSESTWYAMWGATELTMRGVRIKIQSLLLANAEKGSLKSRDRLRYMHWISALVRACNVCFVIDKTLLPIKTGFCLAHQWPCRRRKLLVLRRHQQMFSSHLPLQ
ncbi:uncharacterized protein J3D65DRAFT_264960 [Phyllosticta citribraziliensis]|uniref:Uncharacterized protein n=1 Tax=Phyllosticta citribraziliensis TaxID=989973 RepID=A0ABR1M267_9PEZI